MENLLLNLLIALIGNELIHNAFEIWGIRQKVAWLHARIDKRPHGEWPININTAVKAYGLHVFLFFVITGVFFGLLLALNLSQTVLLRLGILLLVASYALTTLTIHEFHSEIGVLLKRFKR